MLSARIAYKGGVYDATVLDNTVLGNDGPTLRLADGRKISGADVVWLPPTQARTIIALGLNYSDHARELAFKPPTEPLVFLKGPNTLLGHNGVTRQPAGTKNMHYECELAVVIGKTARKIKRENAYDVIGGYTVANDYVIRDCLENYYRPNLRAKNRDGCTIVGPWMVDAASIPDPMNLALRTTVNGKVTQEGSTRDMIFGVPFLIEYLTDIMTLQPGDLILTGTPDGVVHLHPGDVVVTEIEGIGQLKSTIVDDAQFYNAQNHGQNQ